MRRDVSVRRWAVEPLEDRRLLAVGPNGHEYQVIEGSLTWQQANEAAAELTPPAGFAAGHLVTIGDAAEDEFLQTSLGLPAGTEAWTGFTDQGEQGTWKWVDDTPGVWQDGRLHSPPQQTAYVDWAAGQPILPQALVSGVTAVRSNASGPNRTGSNTTGEFESYLAYIAEAPVVAGDSYATQVSDIEPASTRFISANAWTGFDRNGTADSSLQVGFTLAQDTRVSFSGNVSPTSADQAGKGWFSLSFQGHTFYSVPYPSASVSSHFEYSGILQAGRYDLDLGTTDGGTATKGGVGGWDLQFDLVPQQAALIDDTGKWRSASIFDTAPSYVVEYQPLPGGPTDIGLSPAVVLENPPPGTVVGVLSSVGPNQGETFTYTLLGDAGGRFVLDGATVKAANGSLLDYESAASQTIRVKTTDSIGRSFEKDLVIQVNNANDAPLVTLPPDQAAMPGQSLPLAGIVLSDPDIQGAELDVKPLRLSLVADHGTVQFASLSGLAVITGANGTSSMAVEGPLNALNAALGTLSHKAAEGFTGLASLSVSLDDLGHSGEGLPLTEVKTLSIRVNNPPAAVADHYQIGFDRTLQIDSYRQVVLSSGPLAYWRLGDSGPVVEDSAGDYDGTASPATVLGAPGALSGDADRAASFHDLDTRILVSNAAALAQPAGAFSVEAWVNPSESLAWQRIASTRNGPNSGWGFALSNQRLAFTTYGIQDYFLEGHPVPMNQWSHVATVFDANQDVSFYLNGAFVGKVEGSANPHPGGALFAIGDNPDQSAQPWQGLLDEVAFYAKPLTAAEVGRHYQAGLSNATILANDSDADGDSFHAVLVAQPQHGTLQLAPDGAFTYKPNAGFYGQDKFSYRAVDAYFQSAETEVLIDVIPVPGDADLDGDVDLADFGILKRHFGAGTTREQGDFNGDGKVDLSDFGILKAHFGTVEPGEG